MPDATRLGHLVAILDAQQIVLSACLEIQRINLNAGASPLEQRTDIKAVQLARVDVEHAEIDVEAERALVYGKG